MAAPYEKRVLVCSCCTQAVETYWHPSWYPAVEHLESLLAEYHAGGEQ